MAIEKVVNIKVQETGFDDLNSKVAKLENSLEDLTEQNTALRSSMASTGQSVLDNGGAMGLLNMATGGLAQTVKDATEASGLFTKSTKLQATAQKISTMVIGTSTGALKAFRIALVATGIGAIVVALGLLIANFDKVKKVLLDLIPGLGAVADFFGNLIEAVTDFIGVTSDATRALDKMVEDSQKSLDKSTRYLELNAYKHDQYTQRKIKADQDYHKTRLELIDAFNKKEIKSQDELDAYLKQARDRRNFEISESDKARQAEQEKNRQAERDRINNENQKIKDNKKRDDEKAKADEKARIDSIKKINENYAKQIEDLNATTDLQKLELDKKRAEDELNALNASEADKLKLKEFYKLKEQELTKNNNLAIDAINLEYNDKLKELQAVTDEQKADLEEEKLAKEEEKKILELEKLGATEEQKKSVRDYYAGIRLAKEQADAEKQVEIDEMVKDAKIAIADRTLDLISEIAGKGSKIGKAVAVAQATISGIQGAQNAFTTASASPITTAFPAYPFIQAGLAGAFSLLQIKKIMSTDASGKSSPSPTNTSGGGGGGGSSAPSFNIVGGTGSNQIAQSIAGQNQPLQAFVVGSAVTSQQELDRNAINTASL